MHKLNINLAEKKKVLLQSLFPTYALCIQHRILETIFIFFNGFQMQI